MPQKWVTRQRQLFEEQPPVSGVRLPPEVQEQLRQALMHWLRALANALRTEEKGDE